MKVILRFLIIGSVAALGLAMISVLYLFFFPNSKLFGFEYVSYNNLYHSSAYDVTKIDTVKVNSRAYKVNIVPVTAQTASVKVYSNSMGFVKTKNNEVKIDVAIDANILKINIEEPHGLTFKNKSFVDVYLPVEKTFDLHLSNKSAKTYLQSESLKINNFSYSTEKGYLYISKANLLGELNFNLNKAKCYVHTNTVLNTNNLTLMMSSGDLIADTKDFGIITILKNKSGTINVKSCSTISSRIKAGGRYTIGIVDDVNIESEDTNISIEKINNSCSIRLTKSGKVNISIVNCLASIETKSGDIIIASANDALSIVSDEGNVSVASATKKVNATTKYGNISITYNQDVGSYNSENEFRAALINTYNGKVTISGVENIQLTIINKGRANVTMRNVLGNNATTSKLGDINIVVNKSAKFNLVAGGTTGDLNVNFTEIEKFGGYNSSNIPDVVEINGGSADNTLKVTSTKGNIKIVDEVLA